VIIRRLKHFLTNSGTIHQLLETTLKNKNSLVPMIEGQIRQTQIQLETAKPTIDKFSETLQAASMDPTRNLMEVCKALLEEKDKAQAMVEKLSVEILELEHKKMVAKDKFENSTLPEFLEKTVKHFDKLADAEKKKIIQTIIPRIVIDPEKTNQIQIFINPDPESKKPHNQHLTVGHKFLLIKNWLGDSLRTRSPKSPFVTQCHDEARMAERDSPSAPRTFRARAAVRPHARLASKYSAHSGFLVLV
jgi:hypothetical protein